MSDVGGADKKAREEMAKKAGGKGPMNTGAQGERLSELLEAAC
jgi:hypothetical protein